MALVKYNNNSISAITTAGQMATGGMVLIKEQTASSSSTVSFVDGSGGVVLDSTYPIYLLKFINVHPSSTDVNGESFKFNLSIDSGSNYNVSKTSTYFYAIHTEADSTALGYYVGGDLANGTGDQLLTSELGGGSDESCSGEIYLFNPSSTTFVKHFICTVSESRASAGESNNYIAGYANTTSAINAIQFSMIRSGENIQSGTFKLYGIKDS
jgi:hypothetical protein|tara:strand:+ start:110 stop:745 length:636 start_codon:yes stop_codon:yes gene_type:complete